MQKSKLTLNVRKLMWLTLFTSPSGTDAELALYNTYHPSTDPERSIIHLSKQFFATTSNSSFAFLTLSRYTIIVLMAPP